MEHRSKILKILPQNRLQQIKNKDVIDMHLFPFVLQINNTITLIYHLNTGGISNEIKDHYSVFFTDTPGLRTFNRFCGV